MNLRSAPRRNPLPPRSRHAVPVALVGGLVLLGGCKPSTPPAPAPGGGGAAAPTSPGSAASAAGPAAALTNRLAAGSRSEQFAAANEHLDLGGVFYLFADVGGDLKALSDTMEKLMPSVDQTMSVPPDFLAKILARTGLDKVAAVGASSFRDGPLFRNRLVLLTPEGRSGLLAMGGGEPEPFASHAFAPAGSVLVYEVDVSLKPLHDLMTGLVGDFGDADDLQNMEEDLGEPFLPLAPEPTWDQVLQRLDTRLMAVAKLGEGKIEIPGGPALPQVDFVVAGEGLGWLIDAYLPAFQAMAGKVVVADGEDAVTVSLAGPLPGPLAYLKPVLVKEKKDGGRVFLASGDAFLQACLSGASSVADDPAFQTVTRNLPVEGNEFLYLAPEFIGVVRQLVSQGLAMAPDVPRGVPEVVNRVLDALLGGEPAGLASVTLNLPGGIAAVGNGPGSFKSAAAAPIAAFAGAFTVGFAKGIQGSRSAVRTSPQEQIIQNNLRQIASASDQFFIEEGKVKAEATDLVGPDKYLKQLPDSVAGEDYSLLFPIEAGFTELTVTTADGRKVTYGF